MEQADDARTTSQFEFEALREANNYRRALLREFSPYLRGRVVEVGAGIGQNSALLREVPAIERLLCIEPDGDFCRRFRQDFPSVWLLQATVAALSPGPSRWDAIISINVLEHIEDDFDELRRYAALLRAGQGSLCLFVPARPEIYSPLDRDFGHYRRYTRAELSSKLERAGFAVRKLHYFNSTGYFAWWLNFCLLRKRSFDARAVRFYDRVILPATYYLESRLMRPPFGQSLIAVAAAKCS